MKLEQFIKLHKKYSQKGLKYSDTSGIEYEEYISALQNDKKCDNYFLQQKLKERRFSYKKYCCLKMAYHLSTVKVAEYGSQDSDVIIVYDKSHKSYGIPIHDGGSSYIKINNCPWCGKNVN